MLKGCNGPCNQGRRRCPTPEACGLSDEPPDSGSVRAVLRDVLLACAVLAAAWGVFYLALR
jgi:hypothetical protein